MIVSRTGDIEMRGKGLRVVNNRQWFGITQGRDGGLSRPGLANSNTSSLVPLSCLH